MKFHTVFLLCVLISVGEAGMTKDQKRRAEQFTSIFENDTIGELIECRITNNTFVLKEQETKHNDISRTSI